MPEFRKFGGTYGCVAVEPNPFDLNDVWLGELTFKGPNDMAKLTAACGPGYLCPPGMTIETNEMHNYVPIDKINILSCIPSPM
jgi:hypothetical protein